MLRVIRPNKKWQVITEWPCEILKSVLKIWMFDGALYIRGLRYVPQCNVQWLYSVSAEIIILAKIKLNQSNYTSPSIEQLQLQLASFKHSKHRLRPSVNLKHSGMIVFGAACTLAPICVPFLWSFLRPTKLVEYLRIQITSRLHLWDKFSKDAHHE